MKDKLKYTLMILACLSLAVTSCKRTKEEQSYLDHMDEEPIKEAFNVEFIFSEKAIIQAKLEAPHAIELRENEQDVRLFDRGLHLRFYDENGEKKSDLTANGGKFRDQFNKAEVWGNVVMINEDGSRLETERLFWDKRRDRLFNYEFVKIRTKQQLIYGDSLDAATDFRDFIIRDVTGAVDYDENGE